MPSVSYDGQSFQINGRRVWLCGASIPYALIPRSEWKSAIAAAKDSGFNTIETSAPWLLHEPRPGRFTFADGLDVRHFIELCGEAGLRVLLRAGPFIGGRIDGGGLPTWLAEVPGMAIRQGTDVFMERVSLFYHRLFEQVVELQVTRPAPAGREGGALLLVQIEHAWHCANEEQGRKYLQELVRFVRECGITLPLLSANDLWQDVEGTIETWTGSRDLLVNLRQLRAVQSHAPRIASEFSTSGFEVWGEDPPADSDPGDVMVRLAQILAAGGQPFVSPFHPGVNLGFLGGRLAGGAARYATTRAAVGAPLDEAGRRGTTFSAIKRLASFATSFGHVFAELDPDYHPIALDVESTAASGKSRSGGGHSVVPLQGPEGRIVFVFNGAHANGTASQPITLLLENGMRMPVHLGDQSVGWFVLEVDLLGSGNLDFCNLCPHAFVDRSILVVQGPAKAAAFLSINGGPLEATVPTGTGQPLVVDHKGTTVVICNQEQIDATSHDGRHVFVGCRGFDPGGRPVLAPGFTKVWRVGRGGECKPVSASEPPRLAPAPGLAPWRFAASSAFAAGTSARYATLEGPASLTACGAHYGYGWYRVRPKSGPVRKKLLHLIGGDDRLHLFVGGELTRIVGSGLGAAPAPFDARIGSDVPLVVLADNLGRFVEGNDAGERKGLAGPIYEVSPLKGVRAKRVDAPPADPFKLRGFIAHRASGQAGSTSQMQWTFTHRRKSKLIVSVGGLRQAGTVVLNGVPIAYYAGASGGMKLNVLIDPATTSGFKPGINQLRFSSDPLPSGVDEDSSKALQLYEVLKDLSVDAQWSFARWEPPAMREMVLGGKPKRGTPSWWRTTFESRTPAALWLSVKGLSKGAVLLNGRPLGRYFNCTGTGKAVGPIAPLYIPAALLRHDRPNELFVFDEHGFAPTSVRLSNSGK